MKRLLFTLGFIFFLLGFCHAQFTDLHPFNGPEGAFGGGDLVLIGDKLYGEAQLGGAGGKGCIFSMSTNGLNYRDIHSFDSVHGQYLPGNLALSGGKFYGTTEEGGLYNDGIIFCIDTDGSRFMVLHNFDSSMGASTCAQLIISGYKIFGSGYSGIFSMDTNGNGYKEIGSGIYSGNEILSGNTLYGICPGNGKYYEGYVFSIDTDGQGYTDLLDFNGPNGQAPQYDRLLFSENKLYGMTTWGGAHDSGLIFSIKTDGTGYTDLHDFEGEHGWYPEGGLILSGDTLMGTTFSGGPSNSGCIFSMDTAGAVYTDMFDFTPSTGVSPWNMALTLSGNIVYGMTSGAGTYGYGTIFSYRYDYLGIPNTSVNASEVNVYPNPSNGIFNIVFSHAELVSASQPTVEVYNLLGEKVYNATLKQVQGDNSIDLSNQPNGVYLYRVIGNKGELIGSGKLVIQK